MDEIMNERADHDVVVVGASLAGCTTATLLARQGLRVALVEQSPDPGAFKRVCSHYIQSSGVPTLERLGLLEPMLAAGAVRSRGRIWTRYGTIEPQDDSALPAGVNMRRERLDPMVRELAAATGGVELMSGWRVDALLRDGDAIAGVEAQERGGDRVALRARLVVGADGRDSRVARLAEVAERRSPHGRFVYGAYYEGPPPEGSPDATLWMLDPEWAAVFPTDEGLALYGAMPTMAHLPEFKRDPAAALEAYFAALPDPPPIRESRRVSDPIGKIDMTNRWRTPTAPGLALVGDAALATDPLWGVGCGWALQTGEWLADAVAPALRGDESLARGLRRYARRHRLRLGPHALMIHGYATGRPLDASERLSFWAGANDARVAEVLAAYGSRTISPQRMVATAMPRALALRARRSLRSRLTDRNKAAAAYS